MIAEKFDNPGWELAMARKDAGLMIKAASKADRHLMTIPEIAKRMDVLIDQGNGAKDWMIIAKQSK
jgi:3-hydroxyisobutyrate dehydrogenase